MIIWEKELQVKVRRIRQRATRHVEDVENMHTIEERNFVRAVVSEGLQSYVNQAGEIDIDHLMEIKDFTNNSLLFLQLLFTTLNYNTMVDFRCLQIKS